MVLFRGKVCLLVCSLVLLVCTSVSLAKEDPELRTCKHQCRHQRQFDERQKLACERSCEEYIQEKERVQRERERGMGTRMGEDEEMEVSSPRKDPQKEYRLCREECQETEPGRREQQLCERKCEQKRQRGRGSGRDEFDEAERMRGGEEEEEEESGKNPYVFHEEHFDTSFETQEGSVRVLPKFTKRSKLFKGIENFRVVLFEANPQSFVVPNHWDADAIFFVVQGRGTVSLVFKDRRESFNIERGHVMVIPSGVTVYMINRGNNEKLVLAKLINPVSNPGKFVPFFGPGGQNPESFFSAFSDEVLEAAFQTSSDRIQRIFSQQRKGAIVRASEEQIRGLTTHDEGSLWPFGGKGSKDLGPIDLLKQRPRESNEFGKLFELNPSDHKVLQNLGIAVSFANITQGSMHTPFYNSKATKIAVVVNGRGRFEMACPHVSSSAKKHHHHHHHEGDRSRRGEESTSPVHYQKISSELRRGTVFVVPTGHPFVTMASQDENLEVVCFEVNAENNHRFPLAGQKNIMKNFEREAKELAFATSADEVDEIFENPQEEFFFRGPSQQLHRHPHGRIATI